MPKEFEMLHCSCRNVRDSFYHINIIFRPITKEFRGMCELDANDWKKAKATTEPEKVDEYFLGLTMETGNKTEDGYYEVNFKSSADFELDDIYKSCYVMNDHKIFYNEKFDYYQYREYAMINSASDGIFNYIKELASLEETSIYHGDRLLASIKALDFYWD